tara:strand:- start:126 stop:710 length:585 start_codon:yes stop_codon:yes gene_type:complete
MAPTPEEIVLHERPRAHQRCPYCHDALEEAGVGEEIPCNSCGTLHHEVCLEELGGCTVLGCQGGKPRPLGSVDEVRARVRERLARFLGNVQRPPSPAELERIAREGWECEACQHRFWSLGCTGCGAALDVRCRRPGHPCNGCGQEHRVEVPRPESTRDARVWRASQGFTITLLGLLGGLGLLLYLVYAVIASGL